MTKEEPIDEDTEEEEQEDYDEEEEITKTAHFVEFLESRQLKNWYDTGDEHCKIMAEVLYRVTYNIE